MSEANADLQVIEFDDPIEAIERCYELGWTDGLPVVPPTVERVRAFLDYAGRPEDEVLGGVPERRREVTVGKAAANAVMAGCLPEYFPWCSPHARPCWIRSSTSSALLPAWVGREFSS